MSNLWKLTLLQTEKAKQSKSIRPFQTKLQKIEDKLYPYEVRQLIGKPRTQDQILGPIVNPFSPWDRQLEIKTINNTHVLILNKYPVELGHMLLITNSWQPQDGWLNITDWMALTKIESEIDGFWFFNNSPEAGASQPHRHLQLLHRDKEKYLFPREAWFDSISLHNHNQSSLQDRSCYLYRRNMYNKDDSAKELNTLYLRLIEKMEIGNPSTDDKPTISYNLLLTKKWIAIIRRKKEAYNGFNINALGFAGYFLAMNDKDINWLLDNDPEVILDNVVSPI